MQHYIYNLNSYRLFLSCFFILLTFSIFGLLLIKKLNIKATYQDNLPITTIMYTISSIYTVLLALLCFHALINYQSCQKIIDLESDAILKMEYNIKLLGSFGNSIRLADDLITYTDNIIELEWPTKSNGKNGEQNSKLLDQMSKTLMSYKAENANQQTIINNAYYNLIELSQLRQRRFEVRNFAVIPTQEWVSLIVVMLATLIVNMFLTIRYPLHIIMLVILSIVSSIMLTLLVSIDGPFFGEINIVPSEYLLLLQSG